MLQEQYEEVVVNNVGENNINSEVDGLDTSGDLAWNTIVFFFLKPIFNWENVSLIFFWCSPHLYRCTQQHPSIETGPDNWPRLSLQPPRGCEQCGPGSVEVTETDPHNITGSWCLPNPQRPWPHPPVHPGVHLQRTVATHREKHPPAQWPGVLSYTHAHIPTKATIFIH